MKTRILFTIGDINGIAPEIILKTISQKNFQRNYNFTIITPKNVLEYYSKRLKLNINYKDCKIIEVETGKIKIKPGEITSDSGYIAGLSIEVAISLCLSGMYDAVVTAPISKKALNLGGYKYDGHTEMLTVLGKAKSSAMIMLNNKIKIGFSTNHPPLKEVSNLISKELLTDKIKTCYNSLKKDFRIKYPSIGILSLNPHAGEEGLIGNEEREIISDVIARLKKKNKFNLSGPFPSDSYFGNKVYKNFDLTLALYHDQGFIPFRMFTGNSGVNYTAGLSFVRTSPAHGTAFDIAGKGIADYSSFELAVKTADRIFQNRIKKL